MHPDYANAFNFQLQTDGNIIAPTLELKQKKIKLERTSLSDFFKISITNNLDIIELTLAHLASKNMRTSGLPYQVRLIPENKRRNK